MNNKQNFENKYKIIKKIAHGGMSKIYLAIEKSNNLKVIMKILHPEKNTFINKKRFLNEIKLTKKINSQYVVQIYDWFWDENIQYIIMEYIPGETLKDFIISKFKLNIDETIEYSKQLALGLQAIHEAKIIHRDIKPTNIIISNYNQIKIIDFGIALDDNELVRLTKTNNIIASPQYVAPELIDQNIPTLKSDIYSLGIIIFEMLTGQAPYKGKTALDILQKHKFSSVPILNQIFQNIPKSLTNLIIKATSKNPTLRHENMQELFDDLDSIFSNTRINEKILKIKKNKFIFLKKYKLQWFSIFILSLSIFSLLFCIIFIIKII